MDEYEIETSELGWVEGVGNWYTPLVESLEYFIAREGKLSDQSYTTMLSNLIEVQDNVAILNNFSDSYTDGLVENMQKVLKLLLKCASYPSPLKKVLERTARKVSRYLGSIKGYEDKYPYYREDKYPYYREDKKDEGVKSRVDTSLSRLLKEHSIIKDYVRPEIKNKMEELGRMKQVGESEINVLELSQKREESIERMVAKIADVMVLESLKKDKFWRR